VPSVVTEVSSNIGIGTTTPNAPLLVSSNRPSVVGGQSQYVIRGIYTGSDAVDMTGVSGDVTATAANWGIGGDFRGNYIGTWSFGRSSAPNPIFGIKSIGQNTGDGPAYGVYGETMAGGNGALYGVYCSGNGAISGTWVNTSDRKFKRNIQPLATGTLGKLMQVRAVSYDMRTDEFPTMGLSKGKQVGVIAQELAEVFPELVSDDQHPGVNKNDPPIAYKGVNYTGLTPILIKAVQEQQALIEAQQKALDELRARLETLENRQK
jgi:hypothetical protein